MSDPFASVPWAKRHAVLVDDEGRVVFDLDGVEAPASWSETAVNVVASRYFKPGPGGERSVRDLLRRVGGTLSRWVKEEGLGEEGYEAALFDLLLHQRGAFNSPVWFNVGVDGHPQCSACFILSVKDDLNAILELARVEAMIFKYGSGCGTNLSVLRSSRERLSGGGFASGPVSFMRGYDAFAGVVKSGGRTRRAAKMQILDVAHPDIREFVHAKAVEERKAKALAAAGFGGGLDGEAHRSVAFQNSNLSVRVTDDFLRAVREDRPWTTRAVRTGEPVETFPARDLLREIAQAAWECGDPGLQYDAAIQKWHTCPESGRIHATNPCSEFCFLDDTACNLASLNLLSYLKADATFDAAGFRRDAATLFRAMEAIVDRSVYPTQRIAEMSRIFRPLGLGYANLGALLMALGLPYDSAEGRGWAAAITALMTGEAYRVSAEIAGRKGPFEGFEPNRDPMLRVLSMHRAALADVEAGPAPVLAGARTVWDETLRLARAHGVRNAQATVLAPTGTIAFLMDCDTTGIEPDLSLVKYKALAGGGSLKLTNRVVPRALARLGYAQGEIDAIVKHLEREEGMEGAPHVKREHLAVFDCAFRPGRDGRTISVDGHLKMMAAVQPFLSGGISKTVNLPRETTVEEIERLYLRGGELGLKALAVYREGSKGIEPLTTRCLIHEGRDSCCGG
ncbi:MAG TPA: vitamin B12-dependent ribonucleotide reductase [Planctomycetota bacterium]|nr:vitamin B12-dependent ribonucleotide reductase [Planctomycetota bacterium]